MFIWGTTFSPVGTLTAAFVMVKVDPPKLHLVIDPVTDVAYGGQRFITVQSRNQLNQFWSPERTVTYRFMITNGPQWEMLQRGALFADTIAGVPQFTNLPFYSGRGAVFFNAWEEGPPTPQNVAIHVTASDPSIVGGGTVFSVVPSPLVVSVTPPTISYGQSSVIDLKRKGPDGLPEPLPEGTWFDYEIVFNRTAGTLITPDSSLIDDEVFGEYSNFSFLAQEEAPQPDSVLVTIVLRAWPPGVQQALEGLARVLVKKSNHDILLGESKYYYAVADPSDPSE